MDLETTKKFLLVRSVEEADRDGELIPVDRRGLPEGDGSDDGLLVARAEGIYRELDQDHPIQMQSAMAATGSAGWVTILVVVVAFAIGLATKQLGPERRVNVLAFPLMGLLAWNALAYLFVVFRGLLGKSTGGWLSVLMKGAKRKVLQRIEAGADSRLGVGLSRFCAQWFELTAAARLARGRSCLHLGAAALAAGVIAGMYWNGLAFQYLAAWESTFLSPEGVHSLFSRLFAPAAAISGIEVPGLAEIRAIELKAGDEGSSAARWIHLFAITVGLFIVLPRLLMAWVESREAGKHERGIDFREAAPDYIARVLKTRDGGNLVARITPHRMELGSKERDRLRAFAHQLWGGKLIVEFSDPVGYGDEHEAEFEKSDFQMLVLNFSSTPEEESQGRLVKRFRSQLAGDGLVLLEAEPFRERFGGLGEFERRKTERAAAWETILGRAGIGFATYDGDAELALQEAGEVTLKPKNA